MWRLNTRLDAVMEFKVRIRVGPDIRLIFNAGYPVGYPIICRISNVGQISGPTLISGYAP